VANGDERFIKKPADALTLMTCPNVEDLEFPPWQWCVIGNCAHCPLYQVGRYEDNVSDNMPRINYVTCKKQSQCTVHGLCPLRQHKCFSCTNALPGTNKMSTNDTEEGSALEETKKKLVK
jgi:hypothetical protein